MDLEKLRLDLQRNNISVAEAIVNALPKLKANASDDILLWLINELQGYANALDFYYHESHNLPGYRIVTGSLKLLTKDGKLTNVKHSLAERDKFFLSVPTAWLEEFVSLPGETSIVEMPELAHDTSSGHIVLELKKDQLQRVIDSIKAGLLEVLK